VRLDSREADALSSAPCVREPAREFSGTAAVELEPLDENLPCTLVFEPTGIELGSDSAGARPDPDGFVFVRTNAGFFVTSSNSAGTLLVYGPDGRFIRTLGRKGRGPGEITGSFINLFAAPDGGVMVYDGARAWTSFDSSFTYRSRVDGNEIGGDWRYTAIMPDEGIVSGSWPGRTGENFFRLLSPDGKVVRNFGPIDPALMDSPDFLSLMKRTVAAAGADSFWSAAGGGDPRGYIVELWRTDGTLVRSFHRSAPWFTAPQGLQSGATPPPPTILRLSADTSGLIYVMTSVANSDWRPLEPGPNQDDQEEAYYEVHYDVIDGRSGSLLASSQFSQRAASTAGALGFFPETRLAYRLVESAGTGLPKVEILEMRLVNQQSR
jgi:hypothetical protein